MIGYTVRELAEETAHSEITIRRWLRDYKITPIARINGLNRYNIVDVLRAERDTRFNQKTGMFAKRLTV